MPELRVPTSNEQRIVPLRKMTGINCTVIPKYDTETVLSYRELKVGLNN